MAARGAGLFMIRAIAVVAARNVVLYMRKVDLDRVARQILSV